MVAWFIVFGLFCLFGCVWSWDCASVDSRFNSVVMRGSLFVGMRSFLVMV